jgi:hypothetical protein
MLSGEVNMNVFKLIEFLIFKVILFCIGVAIVIVIVVSLPLLLPVISLMIIIFEKRFPNYLFLIEILPWYWLTFGLVGTEPDLN